MTGKSLHFDEEAALEAAAANNNQGNGVGALELKKLLLRKQIKAQKCESFFLPYILTIYAKRNYDIPFLVFV